MHLAWQKFISMNSTIFPWCSMDVQGFSDKPSDLKKIEHNFYTDGDNNFTIVMRPSDGGYILRKCLNKNLKRKL
jgi:hypothetical protein